MLSAFIFLNNCLVSLTSFASVKSNGLFWKSSNIKNLRFSLGDNKKKWERSWKNCLVKERNSKNGLADWKSNKAENEIVGTKLVEMVWYGKSTAKDENLTDEAKTTALDTRIENRLVDKKIEWFDAVVANTGSENLKSFMKVSVLNK